MQSTRIKKKKQKLIDFEHLEVVNDRRELQSMHARHETHFPQTSAGGAVLTELSAPLIASKPLLG